MFYPRYVTSEFCVGKYAVQTFFFDRDENVDHIKLTIPVELSSKSNGITVCVDIAGYKPGGVIISMSDKTNYLYTDNDGNIYTAINATTSVKLNANMYFYADMDKYTTVCVTNDRYNYRTLYINGEEITSVNTGPILTPLYITYIGGNPIVKDGVIARYIDNVIVYDYVVSAMILDTISNIKIENSCKHV